MRHFSGILVSSFLISWILRLRKNTYLLANAGGPIGFAMALLVLGNRILPLYLSFLTYEGTILSQFRDF